MTNITTIWNSGHGLIESGVFFADGRVALLEGSPRTGFSVESWTTLDEIWVADPEAISEVDEALLLETHEWSVFTGIGSWEGEGFLALRKSATKELLWVLHLDSSEHFSEARLEGQIIVAISEEYPERCVWYVPVGEPEALAVRYSYAP